MGVIKDRSIDTLKGGLKDFESKDEEYYQALENLAGDKKIRYVIIDPSASGFITVS